MGEERSTRKAEIEKLWKRIDSMVSTKTIWAGISIFVIMSIAVVGFLWRNQTANRNEIMSEVKAISAVILGKDGSEGLSERFKKVETQLKDHLEESHRSNGKNGNKK